MPVQGGFSGAYPGREKGIIAPRPPPGDHEVLTAREHPRGGVVIPSLYDPLGDQARLPAMPGEQRRPRLAEREPGVDAVVGISRHPVAQAGLALATVGGSRLGRPCR